jgi:hypothetical protein
MRTPAIAAGAGGAPWRSPRHRAHDLDGWLGTPEFPGYRAGRIVARLSSLPAVAPGQLYLDVLLLDSSGRTCDAVSGACASLSVTAPTEMRSRFVCVIAELLRHAGTEDGRFSAISAAVALLRELGVERAALMSAAKLLDVACGEAALVESLADMLELSLGEDEAPHNVAELLERLVRTRVMSEPLVHDDADSLRDLLLLLVRGLGKHRVRHVLRMGTDFDLVPQVTMYRV